MSDDKNTNLPVPVEGSGGGGKGGGGAPTEVKDNQFSNVIAKVLVAYSSGETDGLIGGTNGIFLDQTQLSGNFQGVTYDQRFGSEGQSSVPGFEKANSVKTVGVEMDAGTPVVRTVTDAEVDAVRIIITVPSLQDIEPDGDIKGTSINLEFSVKDPSSGIWEARQAPTISGKSSGPFQKQYTIRGPSNITGAWDWRVIRTTANSTSSRLSNDSTVQAANEIRYGKETYPGTAYVALEFDTQDFGNNIPAVAFRVSGARVRVPNNYFDNGSTPYYSGIWNGGWKWMSTENPVWHLYYLLTDNEIGLGLDESFVDRYNFYESARYCDAVNDAGSFVGIPDGNGGVRRRFTLNTQITGQKDGLEMLQDIASSMRAVLYFGAGAVVLKQDMPRNTARIVTNENVKDGTFFYSSTPAKDRITVAKVGYNDPDDFFNIKYARYPEFADWNTDPNIQRYGRNEVEVTKFGCSSEAEAYTFAKWIVYSSCNETRTATFTGNMEFMLTRPGDILEIADRRLAGAASFDQRFGGRIAGGTLTSVVLDSEVTLTAGETYTITIIAADGESMETRDIVTPAGTVTEVEVDSTFFDIPTKGFTWLIQGTDIVPQKFSVIHTERKEGLEVEVFAIQHDDQKFAAVEQNVAIVPKPYTKLEFNEVAAPQNLQFQPIQQFDPAKGVRHSLIVKWDPSPTPFVSEYKVRWRKDQGSWKNPDETFYNEIEIEDATQSFYEVLVYAKTPLGFESIPLSGSYTLQYGGNDFDWNGAPVSIYSPVITSDSEFTTKNLTVEWTRNNFNNVPGIVFNDYVVEFIVNGVVMKTVTTRDTKATYTYDEMVETQGVTKPSNVITVTVRERDTFLHNSPKAELVMTNPVPFPPSIVSAPTFDTKDLLVKWDRTPPLSGVLPLYEDFEVEFVVDTVVVRTEFTRDLSIIYHYSDMVQDQGTSTPSRTITVRVRERNTLFYESDRAFREFTNPPPAIPNFEINEGFNFINTRVLLSNETDLAGYFVFRSDVSTFTPSAANLIYKGPSNTHNDSGLSRGTTYYYKIAAYDMFDDSITELNTTAVIEATTLDLDTELAEYEFEGIKFSLSGNTVNWTGGTVYVRKGSTATQVVVPAGSELWTSGTLYVYFNPLTDSIETGTQIADIFILSKGVRILASYDGTTIQSGISEPIIDGANILAQTIGATQVVSSNLITNSAQIADATIINANVANVSADKILSGTIQATESIVSDGVIKAVSVIGSDVHEAGLGRRTVDGDEYLFWAVDNSAPANSKLNFGVHSNGDIFFGDRGTGQFLEYSNGVLQLGPQTTIGKNETQSISVGNESFNDFTTINDALEYLSKIVPAYKQGGFTARVSLHSSYVMNEQVIVSDIDLSWITIRSSTPLSVNAAGFTKSILQKRPAFAAINGATTPRLDLNLVSSNSVLDDDTVAYMSYGSNSLLLANELYASGFDTGLYANKNARVECVEFSLNNMKNYGIYCQTHCNIKSQLSSSVLNAGNDAIKLTRSTLECQDLTVSCQGNGGASSRIISVQFNSMLYCFTLNAQFTSLIDSIGVEVSITSELKCSNQIQVANSTHGITVSDASRFTCLAGTSSGNTIVTGGSSIISSYDLNSKIYLNTGSYLSRDSTSTGSVIGVAPNTISSNGIYIEH